MASIYDFSVKDIHGKTVKLDQYKGKVMLIVNTASKCGFTPQYKGLEALHEEMATRGFVVLGFPSNEFGGQEPGSAGEIATFCKRNYGVTFPLTAKYHVRGGEAHPFYKWAGEKAGRQTATYSAPSAFGVEYCTHSPFGQITACPARISVKPSRVVTRSMPRSTIVYSSNSGV